MIKTKKYKLFHDDNINVLQKLKSNSIDLVVTSPPYDNLRTYENTCVWSFSVFKVLAQKLFYVLKDGGIIVWIVNDATINGSETGTSFKQALYFKKLGFNLYDTMIWEKPCPTVSNSEIRYANVFEYMFILSKGNPKTFNAIKDRKNIYAGTKSHGGRRNKDGTISKNKVAVISDYGARYNVWKISQASSSSERTGHPAQFPVQLAYDHIISWSNKNDIVLDPFMGSGSTGVACMKLQRRFIGIEIVDKYFDIANKRINKTYNTLANLTWINKK